MSHPWPFHFEGQFLGFAADGTGKVKYLNLGLPATESVKIKLPKSDRTSLRLMLQPGDMVRVRGVGKLNFPSGELKLRADQILPLSKALSPVFSCPLETTPCAAPAPGSSPKPKVKILICQKSGCRKRGGDNLRRSLEKALCDRNWQHHVRLEETGCLKRCSKAPNFTIILGKQCYSSVHESALEQLDALIRDNA
jgi:hypothetical protein